MSRSSTIRLAVVSAWALAGLSGCGARQGQELRRAMPADPPALQESAAIKDSQMVKGFFKPTRQPGGWSDEANEIERNLGVR